MLTNNLKISDTTKKEFFERSSLRVTKKYGKTIAVQISAVFWYL